MKQIDLNKYQDFVKAVTSEASNDLTTFMNRLDVIDGNYDFANNQHGPSVNVPLMLTGSICQKANYHSVYRRVLNTTI